MGPEDSRPKWVRIHRSSVNGRSICASLGTDQYLTYQYLLRLDQYLSYKKIVHLDIKNRMGLTLK